MTASPEIVAQPGSAGDDGAPDDRAHALLETLGTSPPDGPQYAAAREELVGHYLPLARRLAGRFRNRGEPLDDLTQVALLGLLKAIDGFDPDRGVKFTSYAVPTMLGEIKRHFRDKGWSVHVPRRLKELGLNLNAATSTLTQALGRTPTDADLAAYLDASEAEIRECRLSAHGYRASSMSAVSALDDCAVEERLGSVDAGLSRVEDRATLRLLIAELPDRQQRILGLRFFGSLTQAQIAERVGVSQMHVSRLLAKSLDQLRSGMLDIPA